ncbi:MAG: hypothetical protein ACM3JH_13910 [Acidithiobacillales bacterium]
MTGSASTATPLASQAAEAAVVTAPTLAAPSRAPVPRARAAPLFLLFASLLI